jgi:NADH-quinone oxidoreductase subunit N
VNPDVILSTGPTMDPLNRVQGIAGSFNPGDLVYQAPLAALVLGGLLVILLDAFSREGTSRKWLMYFSVASCGIALLSAIGLWQSLGTSGPRSLFSGMLIADRFGMLLVIGILAASILTLLLSSDYMREHAVEYGEYYALVLFAASGMVMLVMSSDLVTVFLGIETMSLGVYVLTGSFRRHRRSTEAAMKYFLTGAFVSGFLLYGIALVYGMTGTTNLAGIGAASGRVDTSLVFLIGVFMLLASFFFKIAAVPFHMWAPDAYEGAPTPVTAFMSAGVKAAGIATLLRVFTVAFGGEVLPFGRMGWATTITIVAALTMTLGNLVALRQDNVKRMLAYSSISHAGYLLLGVAAAGLATSEATRAAAVSSTQFYLLAYTFTAIGAFGVVAWIGSKGDERQMLDDWAGLGTRHPAAALAMTIFMLSLGGVPPLAGFFGKFYVFRAAMAVEGSPLTWLVIVAALNSVASIFYYLKVVMAMYFRDPAREAKPLRSGAVVAALAIAAAFVVQMGVLPNSWIALAAGSAMGGAPSVAGTPPAAGQPPSPPRAGVVVPTPTLVPAPAGAGLDAPVVPR